jgi:hypothetical protein
MSRARDTIDRGIRARWAAILRRQQQRTAYAMGWRTTLDDDRHMQLDTETLEPIDGEARE